MQELADSLYPTVNESKKGGYFKHKDFTSVACKENQEGREGS